MTQEATENTQKVASIKPASPQVENGFTKIANELFDAILQYGFSKRQLAVLLAVIRKTYGYNKTEDDMTVTQLAQVSGLQRQNASTALNELEAIGAVSKRDGRYGYKLKINKNYQTWGESKRDASKRCASKRDGDRLKTMRRASQNDAHKRQSQKTITKDKGAMRPDGLPASVSDEVWQSFVDHRKSKGKPLTKQAETLTVNKLAKLEADGNEPNAVLEQTIERSWTGVFAVKSDDSESADVWQDTI